MSRKGATLLGLTDNNLNFFEKQLEFNKKNHINLPQEKQLEALNQVLKNSSFCIREHGVHEEEPNYYYTFITVKEKTKSSYLKLAKLANKIALSLYRDNIDQVKVELYWGWSTHSTEETQDTVPNIVFEIRNNIWDKAITTILNVHRDAVFCNQSK